MKHEYFPEEFLALQKELQNHPDILAKLQGRVDQGDAYGIIAAELGILLDGVYEQIDMCKMLLRKLKERGALVVIHDPSMQEIRVKAKENVEDIDVTIEPVRPPDSELQ